jgi:hypothetical protein
MTFGTSLRAKGLSIGYKMRASAPPHTKRGYIRNTYHPVLIQLLAPLLLAPLESESVNLIRNPKGCEERPISKRYEIKGNRRAHRQDRGRPSQLYPSGSSLR